MMPCLSASRGYRPSPFSSPTSTTCSSSCAVVSDTKSTSISSSGSEISSLVVPQKKARTRRKRPQQMYNEAAAALSAIYPKIFSQRNCGPHRKKIDSKVWKKIEPLRFKEVGVPELLSQEVPTLIGRVREVEETELLCNEGIPPELKCGIGDQASRRQVSRLVENDSDDSKFKSLSLSEVEVDVSSPSSYDGGGSEYKCFLESSDGDIDEGIMSSIMGSDANPETEDGFGVFGFVQGTEYNLQSSAIRALRRTSDSMVCPVFDYSFPRLKLSDRSMTEERNTGLFPSLDLLKRDDSQHRLKLQLNYEDVINAWSDRGPLYTVEVQDPQMVPDDSYSDPMATNMVFDMVPDLGFWSSAGDGFYGQMEDRSSTVLEDGKINGSGVREASVLRYKEKRRTRLFSKKIRYEVRKLNAERRPRMKGRFVRRLADL